MIHVDRNRIAAPGILSGKRASMEYERAAGFFSRSKKEKAQFRFQFKQEVWTHEEVRNALGELFHGKCAYCEIKLTDSSDVDHFRPKYGAMNLDGKYDQGHYWWLAFEWRNLYLACPVCNRTKRNIFPVESERLPLGTPYESLIDEKPLLIDPCCDNPADFLIFTDNGEVVSEKEKGKVTIELLGLNSLSLVGKRHLKFRSLKELYESWQTSRDDSLLDLLLQAAAPTGEFSGMARQFLLEWEVPENIPEEEVAPQVFAEYLTAQKRYTVKEREEAQREHKIYKSALEDYDLEASASSENLIILDQTIVRLELENFRVFEHLQIDLAAESSKRSPWRMLLGENGCGKSSVLQAVAMALAGEKLRHQLVADHRLRPASYVRRGADFAVVRIQVAGLTDVIELRIHADGKITGTASKPRMPILAYGATRLLPWKGSSPTGGTRYARITGLFDPFAPLADATSWLLSLSADQFDTTIRTLKQILNLGEDVILDQNHQTGQIEIPWLAATSLEELSAGYQSVVAMAVDIMKVMMEHFTAMEAARGIVLIDEVGAHLHPQWRMRIVARLRDAFPGVQFLTTTHDPLCLRGLHDGEVVVFKKTDDGSVFTIEDLPSINGLRVDQLLTSEHFGMSSTIDPGLEEAFVRYQDLLGIKQRSSEEEDELKILATKLESFRVLGNTRRERMMLAAIDRFLGQERHTDSKDHRERLKLALDNKLDQIMSSKT